MDNNERVSYGIESEYIVGVPSIFFLLMPFQKLSR